MTIHFGVNWFDRGFFDARRDAFQDQKHREELAKFGKQPKDIKIAHKTLGTNKGE